MTTFQIPRTTLLVGPRTWPTVTASQPISLVDITIDRSISGGLDSKPASVQFELKHEWSRDNGQTWEVFSSSITQGGLVTDDHGNPLHEQWDRVSWDPPRPAGTQFRSTTSVTGQSVVIAGTVTVE